MYINYTIYSTCGPRLFLFTWCDPDEPRVWTPMIDVQGQISVCTKDGSHRLDTVNQKLIRITLKCIKIYKRNGLLHIKHLNIMPSKEEKDCFVVGE